MFTKVGIKRMTRNFCNWEPKMPKHKTIIDKSSYRAPHQVWDMKDANKVEITHLQPVTLKDRVAYYMMKVLRKGFDFFTRYEPGKMNEAKYLRRCIFLETVAGVPGMIGGMARHLAALRSLREDGGWIHHLLEEAENERMHLLTFLNLKQPSAFERGTIVFAQFVFVIYYSVIYMLSYRMAHRFVGYLEEEAVKTYTNLIKELDEGKLPLWTDKPAHKDAIRYWDLPQNATLRDVFVAIRADEVAHREYNHHFADLEKTSAMTKEEYHIKDDNKPVQWTSEKTEEAKI